MHGIPTAFKTSIFVVLDKELTEGTVSLFGQLNVNVCRCGHWRKLGGLNSTLKGETGKE